MSFRDPSIFWGVVLVGIGALFLLANTGALDRINWDYVWPLAIIGVGVWLLAARLAPGGAVTSTDTAEPLNGITKARLEVAVGGGRINLGSAALGDQLYKLHLENVGNPPEIKLDRSTGTVTITQRPGWRPGIGRFKLEGQLTDSVVWESLSIKTGAGEIHLDLPPPKGVVPVAIDGGAMSVHITRPAGAAIKLQARGGAVDIHGNGTHENAVGTREWQSTGFDAATDRYEVAVSGGALDVKVDVR